MTVLTGAGISAGSGIPTFRGAADALWNRYRPEDLATPQAFARDPELVWRWYDWRRGLIAAAEPNAAHRALAALQERARVHARHAERRRAAPARRQPRRHRVPRIDLDAALHGLRSRRTTTCACRCRCRRCCDACGALLRPGVVWFGEGIDPEVMRRAARAAAACDLMVVVGTAGAVYPAAGLVSAARQAGARVLEFNLEPGGVTHLADLFVPGDAARTLPGLVP